MGLALVKDLREFRAPLGDEEIADFETDVLAGFVLSHTTASRYAVIAQKILDNEPDGQPGLDGENPVSSD